MNALATGHIADFVTSFPRRVDGAQGHLVVIRCGAVVEKNPGAMSHSLRVDAAGEALHLTGEQSRSRRRQWSPCRDACRGLGGRSNAAAENRYGLELGW